MRPWRRGRGDRPSAPQISRIRGGRSGLRRAADGRAATLAAGIGVRCREPRIEPEIVARDVERRHASVGILRPAAAPGFDEARLRPADAGGTAGRGHRTPPFASWRIRGCRSLPRGKAGTEGPGAGGTVEVRGRGALTLA